MVRISVVGSLLRTTAAMLCVVVTVVVLRVATRPALSPGTPADIAGTSEPAKAPPGDRPIVTIDDPIWSLAKSAPLPQYPEVDRQNGTTGVVVALLHLDASRHLSAVDILEAPSASIARSVEEAVGRWQFHPPGEEPWKVGAVGRGLQGKATFYFVRRAGNYEVRSPANVPPSR